jgi:hypothetical protein
MKKAGSGGALRLALLAVLATSAALLVPSAASAASTTGTSFNQAPVSGKANNGKAFHGTYTVQRFVNRSGQTYAIGKLTGQVGNRSVSKNGVALPVLVNSTPSGRASASATCGILDLTLGPLDLNLLGLRVQLNQVHLQITAISGPGNLLGNLLCGVANLLNNNTGGVLTSGQVTQLLNIVLALVNNPGLLNL